MLQLVTQYSIPYSSHFQHSVSQSASLLSVSIPYPLKLLRYTPQQRLQSQGFLASLLINSLRISNSPVNFCSIHNYTHPLFVIYLIAEKTAVF